MIHLGPTQSVLLEFLMKQEISSRHQIAEALQTSVFDVHKHIHYLNKKLSAAGVQVRNRRGEGYYFDRTDRMLIESKLLTSRRAA